MIDLIQVAGVRGGCPAVTHDRTLMTGPAAPDTKTPPPGRCRNGGCLERGCLCDGLELRVGFLDTVIGGMDQGKGTLPGVRI